METIVYFYKARGINEAVLEKMRRKKRDGAYDLIKVALPASLWEKSENCADYLDALCERILSLCGDNLPFYVCEESVKKLNIRQDSHDSFNPYAFGASYVSCDFPEIYFPGREFRGYRSPAWAEELVAQAGAGDWLLIGFMPCILELLCEQARHIRSIKWTLSEALYTRRIENFVEDYYVEYGIAIDMQIRKVTDASARYYPRSTEPVTVLDCLGKERLSAAGLGRGSVWLDFDADEGKRHRIECQNKGISYFSLKKIWLSGQNTVSSLDTTRKSRYNT